MSFGAGDRDAYLIKTDANGNALWTKTYGGTAEDYGNSVQQANDSGFVIVGTTTSFGAGYYDVSLFKTDVNGTVLWAKTFGGTVYEDANSIEKTNDGGYIIAGSTTSFGAGGYDVYVIKTDASGNNQWTKTFGGSSDDGAFKISQTSDSGYVISGYTYSFGAGQSDIYLLRLTATGDTLWTKTYGGTDTDLGDYVQQTSDSGFIIAGQSFSFGVASDAYLIKTDANGNIFWTKTYGGTAYDFGSTVQITSDGGYSVIASAQSFGAGGSDIYLIKTDGSGNSGCNQGGTATVTGAIGFY